MFLVSVSTLIIPLFPGKIHPDSLSKLSIIILEFASDITKLFLKNFNFLNYILKPIIFIFLYNSKVNYIDSGIDRDLMQPAKTPDELAEMYPDLEPWQRDELEVWHKGWITKMMTGEASSEEYNAAIPPHPDPYHPED